MDKVTRKAIGLGEKNALNMLNARKEFLRLRDQNEGITAASKRQRRGGRVEGLAAKPAGGVLVAEGDSWFDYPFYSILHELEDRYYYDIESVAHRGDSIEGMAYGGGCLVEGKSYIGAQLEELMRRIEKLLKRKVVPKDILLSGGGNDVAGTEFGMLLNHAQSPIAGLNTNIVEGVINQRVRNANLTILNSITVLSRNQIGHSVPILVHG